MSKIQKIFKSAINYHNYDIIKSNSKNMYCGKIPKQITNRILSCTSENKKDEFIKVKNSFSQAADVLKQLHSQEIQTLTQYDFAPEDVNILFKWILEKDGPEKEALKKEFYKKVSSKKHLLSNMSKAENVLNHGLSDFMKDGEHVNVSLIGNGSMSYCYKVAFLDKNNNSFIKDMALKIYRGKKESLELLFARNTLFQKIFKSIANSFAGNKEFETAFDRVKLMPTQLNPNIEKQLGVVDTLHGINADANMATYLRNASGHNPVRNGLVLPEYFDMEKGYSLAPFVNPKGSKKIANKINFFNYGIKNYDDNEANLVGGFLVDIGGLEGIEKELQDKVVLRYYKKIKNQKSEKGRNEIIQRLVTEAQNPKNMFAGKIKKAISIFETESERKKLYSQSNETITKLREINQGLMSIGVDKKTLDEVEHYIIQ